MVVTYEEKGKYVAEAHHESEYDRKGIIPPNGANTTFHLRIIRSTRHEAWHDAFHYIKNKFEIWKSPASSSFS